MPTHMPSTRPEKLLPMAGMARLVVMVEAYKEDEEWVKQSGHKQPGQ